VTAGFAAATADHRHVLAITTHRLSALASSVARFIGIEFVRSTLGVRRFATLARDLALLRSIHRCETAITPSSASVFHVVVGVRVARRVAQSIAVDRYVTAIVVA
jgi:hypothetical protein